MPQMAPISWLLMFILFLLSFLFLMILTFFNFNISFKKKNSLSFIKSSIDWKW